MTALSTSDGFPLRPSDDTILVLRDLRDRLQEAYGKMHRRAEVADLMLEKIRLRGAADGLSLAITCVEDALRAGRPSDPPTLKDDRSLSSFAEEGEPT